MPPGLPGDGLNSTRRQDRRLRRPTPPSPPPVIALVTLGVLIHLDSTPHPLKEAVVGIGTSIFLLAAGAILTFALDASVGGVNLDVIGWILMAAGLLGLIMTALVWGRRRQVVTTTEPVEYRRVEERRDIAPPL
ncbi:hypothetical protein FHX75_14240 [Micromonospora palomenae]|uniref:DUF6458 domain-containing protein n=1 Tax=Micromonospora palomenae TaxID=1461247 RepID=A0A561VJW4_9ACTN|nr:hypothetical protein FHX75_14240 [Micromonospora palomenae]